MQHDELWLSALGCQHLGSHLQQRFVTGVFIRFEVTAFEELNLISALRNAGDGRIVFTNLSLIGKPPCLEARTVSQGDKVILELGFIIHYPIKR